MVHMYLHSVAMARKLEVTQSVYAHGREREYLLNLQNAASIQHTCVNVTTVHVNLLFHINLRGVFSLLL